MRQLLLLLFISAMSSTLHAAAGMDLYLVRHAQTIANASGHYSDATSNRFSAEGEHQVMQLTAALQEMRFDAVLVSSVPRALDTILPYLRQSGQKGEVWPELAECCWQRERGNSHAGRLVFTSEIVLSEAQRDYFAFRDREAMRDYGNDSYADGVAHVERAVELLRERFFGTGKKILVVAHYHSGQVLLSELTGLPRDALPNLQNGKVTHLHQDSAGHFTLEESNTLPAALLPAQ